MTSELGAVVVVSVLPLEVALEVASVSEGTGAAVSVLSLLPETETLVGVSCLVSTTSMVSVISSTSLPSISSIVLVVETLLCDKWSWKCVSRSFNLSVGSFVTTTEKTSPFSSFFSTSSVFVVVVVSIISSLSLILSLLLLSSLLSKECSSIKDVSSFGGLCVGSGSLPLACLLFLLFLSSLSLISSVDSSAESSSVEYSF